MAKFFKNYDYIDLKIFNEVRNGLGNEILDQLNIEPKYLAMLYLKHCDFCLNHADNDTHIECINLDYGYQTCDTCYKKNIGKTYIKNWFVKNNYLPCHLFHNTILYSQETVRVQRTSGIFEDMWVIDWNGNLQYIIRTDNTEDIRIPIHKTFEDTRLTKCQKNIYLSELCRFNNLDEVTILDLFKNELNKFKLG
jgi:hypothetical protein